MTYESFPNDAHNNRVITLAEHEQIMMGIGGLSGLLFYSGGAPLFADSTGLQVKIPANIWASIRGTRFNNTSTTAVPIGANTSGKTRIDLVVLRLRRQETSLGAGNQYTIVPFVIAGTPGDNPVAPAPVRDATSGVGFWDVPLGEVTVAHNATGFASAQLKQRGYWITGSGYTGRDDWGKPPVEPGVLFHAADTGITYIGATGGAWLVLRDDSGWVSLEGANGWSTNPTGWAQVRRVNRVAYLRLNLFRVGDRLPSGSGVVQVGAVPSGFEPEAKAIELGSVSYAGAACRFVIGNTRALLIDQYSPINQGNSISVSMQWPLD